MNNEEYHFAKHDSQLFVDLPEEFCKNIMKRIWRSATEWTI